MTDKRGVSPAWRPFRPGRDRAGQQEAQSTTQFDTWELFLPGFLLLLLVDRDGAWLTEAVESDLAQKRESQIL